MTDIQNALQGGSAHSGSPSHSPSHTSYQVQSTYFPSEDHYVQQQQADDDPFNLKGSDNPFANTLSGQSEVVAVPDHSTVTINTGDRQANVVLQFQGTASGYCSACRHFQQHKCAMHQASSAPLLADSQLPTHATTGKMGGDQVPRGRCNTESMTCISPSLSCTVCPAWYKSHFF